MIRNRIRNFREYRLSSQISGRQSFKIYSNVLNKFSSPSPILLNRDTNLIPEVSTGEIISSRIACWPPPLRRFSTNIRAIFQTRDDPARLERDRVTDRGKFRSPRLFGKDPFRIIFDEKSCCWNKKERNEYFFLSKRKLQIHDRVSNSLNGYERMRIRKISKSSRDISWMVSNLETK